MPSTGSGRQPNAPPPRDAHDPAVAATHREMAMLYERLVFAADTAEDAGRARRFADRDICAAEAEKLLSRAIEMLGRATLPIAATRARDALDTIRCELCTSEPTYPIVPQ